MEGHATGKNTGRRSPLSPCSRTLARRITYPAAVFHWLVSVEGHLHCDHTTRTAFEVRRGEGDAIDAAVAHRRALGAQERRSVVIDDSINERVTIIKNIVGSSWVTPVMVIVALLFGSTTLSARGAAVAVVHFQFELKVRAPSADEGGREARRGPSLRC